MAELHKKKLNGIRAKVYRSREDWAMVIAWKDYNNNHLLYYRQELAQDLAYLNNQEFAEEHLKQFNGLYEQITVDGKVTVTKNCQQLANPSGYDLREKVCCTLINKIFGENSTGYTHNYTFADNEVYESD